MFLLVKCDLKKLSLPFGVWENRVRRIRKTIYTMIIRREVVVKDLGAQTKALTHSDFETQGDAGLQGETNRYGGSKFLLVGINEPLKMVACIQIHTIGSYNYAQYGSWFRWKYVA